MKSVSMEVTASPQAAPSQPVDLQTVNGQEEAAAAAAATEARRKAADDEEWTSEDLDEEEKKREKLNRKAGDKPVLRKRVKKGQKKSQTGKPTAAKNGVGMHIREKAKEQRKDPGKKLSGP